MRFLHVADVHLDTSFAGRSDAVRRRLREASRTAFRRVVDLALREGVDAVLVAGDLFDGDRLSFQTERFLLEQAHRLVGEGVAMVYATGNHDPGGPEAGPRSLDWPPGVHVAHDEVPLRIEVTNPEGGTVGYVSAVGHRTRHERDDLSRRIPAPDGSVPEVALLHTQVHTSVGAEEHHAYAPSELSRLVRAGFDYWALGHVHVRQVLSRDPPIVYAGSLQGKTRKETGPKGAMLVDLSDRSAPGLDFVPLAPVRWETVRVGELADADSLDALVHRVGVEWSRLREADDARARGTVEWMVRVTLEGPCPLWRELRQEDDRSHLARELTDELDALEVSVAADGVHPVLPVEEHRRRVDVLGASLRKLEAVRGGENVLTTLEASELAGLREEDPEALREYVRGVLEGVDAELAARFLGTEGA